MDNITHSLIGAVIGQTGLKKLSGLGMPTLIIAANIPDIDASCAVFGVESLAMRRGLTHGPIAMLLLPLVLTAIMVGWDRWQTRRGTRPAARLAVKPLQLYLLSLIGTLSHPLFDWLNNYGVRLLEPFSHRWFYGDTLFIVDLWIWIGLGLSLWLSFRRERRNQAGWPRPAQIGLVGLMAYVLINASITYMAESDVRMALTEAGVPAPLVVASPTPILFWQRDVFWRSATHYGTVEYTMASDTDIDTMERPTGMDDPRIARAKARQPDVAAFLFWSRMPVATHDGDAIVLTDQRYSNDLVRSRFAVRILAERRRPAQ